MNTSPAVQVASADLPVVMPAIPSSTATLPQDGSGEQGVSFGQVLSDSIAAGSDSTPALNRASNTAPDGTAIAISARTGMAKSEQPQPGAGPEIPQQQAAPPAGAAQSEQTPPAITTSATATSSAPVSENSDTDRRQVDSAPDVVTAAAPAELLAGLALSSAPLPAAQVENGTGGGEVAPGGIANGPRTGRTSNSPVPLAKETPTSPAPPAVPPAVVPSGAGQRIVGTTNALPASAAPQQVAVENPSANGAADTLPQGIPLPSSRNPPPISNRTPPAATAPHTETVPTTPAIEKQSTGGEPPQPLGAAAAPVQPVVELGDTGGSPQNSVPPTSTVGESPALPTAQPDTPAVSVPVAPDDSPRVNSKVASRNPDSSAASRQPASFIEQLVTSTTPVARNVPAAGNAVRPDDATAPAARPEIAARGTEAPPAAPQPASVLPQKSIPTAGVATRAAIGPVSSAPATVVPQLPRPTPPSSPAELATQTQPVQAVPQVVGQIAGPIQPVESPAPVAPAPVAPASNEATISPASITPTAGVPVATANADEVQSAVDNAETGGRTRSARANRSAPAAPSSFLATLTGPSAPAAAIDPAPARSFPAVTPQPGRTTENADSKSSTPERTPEASSTTPETTATTATPGNVSGQTELFEQGRVASLPQGAAKTNGPIGASDGLAMPAPANPLGASQMTLLELPVPAAPALRASASDKEQPLTATPTVDPAQVSGAPRPVSTPEQGPVRESSLRDSNVGTQAGAHPWFDQVTRAVRTSYREGQEIRIKLNPPELGAMQIDVSLRDGTLTARLDAQVASTQQVLRDNLPQLKETLAQQGFTVDRIEVGRFDAPVDARTNFNQQSPQHQQSRQESGEAGYGAIAADTDAPPRAPAMPAPRGRAPRGQLDIQV